MSESSVSFPTKEEIECFHELHDSPILDDVPYSSPRSIFLHLSSGTAFGNQTFSKVASSAGSEISEIQMMDEMATIADDYIYKLFSRRSISKALLPLVDRIEAIPENETDEQLAAREARQKAVREATTPYYDELFNLLNDTKQFAHDVVCTFNRIISQGSQWESGHYSGEFVKSFCNLFYRLATLDEIHLVKPSLSNDLTNLLSYKSSGQAQSQDRSFELKSWVSQENSIETELFNSLMNINDEIRSKFFHVVMPIIMNQVKGEKFIAPETLYAYLRTSIFLLRLTKMDGRDADVLDFLQQQASLHPLIPLEIELAQPFDDLVKKSGAFPGFKFKAKKTEIMKIYDEMKKFSSNFLFQLQAARKNDISAEEFYNFIVYGCKCIGKAKNALREQLVEKLLNPPEFKDMKLMYERSLRIGYTSEDLSIVLRVISVWRSINDLLRDNFEDIYRLVVKHINMEIQEFAKNTLEKVCIHTKIDHDQLMEIMNPLRAYVGDWKPDEDMGGSQANTKNMKVHTIIHREAATTVSAVQYLRIQVQHVINEGSEFIKEIKKVLSATTPIAEKDVKTIKKFIDDSQYFIEILQLDQLLVGLADQSDLYFREVQLDINNVVCFSIRASLPFILCEHALGNRKDFTGNGDNHINPELCDLVLFPLAIYDDAAMRASTKLKSKMILDEIKNEAAICLSTLTTLVSDFTFESFRAYTATKFIPKDVFLKGKKNYETTTAIVPAFKLSTMIIQNQYYLHGKIVNIKALISNMVDKNMINSVKSIIGLYTKNGICVSIAISKVLDILRETRRLLCENGILLMPFDEMVSSAMGSSNLNSFNSKLITSISTDINHTIAYKYYMRSNPTRLISKTVNTISASPFGKGAIASILRDALSQTMSIITIEHISAFVKIADSGSVSYIIHEMMKDLKDKFSRFTALYQEQRPRLQRFRDEPMGTPGTLVYDRFEGAYRFFMGDQQIMQVFKAMKAIGNILAVASMLDIAIAMKNVARAEVIGYFRGLDRNICDYSDNIKEFVPDGLMMRDLILKANDIITGKETHPPLLSHLLSYIISDVEKSQCFEETSSQFLCFETLTGFASAWSVLEFVFNMLETNRKKTDMSPYTFLGEGVMFFAAVMLCITDQEKLHFTTNIGRRIERVKDVDFASASDDRLSRFCSVWKLESSSLEWAKSVVSPIIRQIKLAQQYE